ncbi:MAG: GDP-mannose 4,6-dehydratase [Nanoarchaeota archaeon]|nr:GDP-mannose 4,6-dehydratase [Nanoarchaeota archaeon]
MTIAVDTKTPKKALITGITGFVGSHLAEHMMEHGYEVYGTVRWRSKTENIDHIKDKLKLIECDLRDLSSVQKAINEVKPNVIFHLAAQSFVHASFHAPQECITTNILGNVNLLEAVRMAKSTDPSFDPIIQIAGSSEEYGHVKSDECPITEDNPLRPMSPYGVSKVAQDLISRQYYKSYGIKSIVTRAFNHEGPRRGDVFVTSNFAQQVANIESGKQDPVIKHGNLDAKRDFTDVRDMVVAYRLCVEKGVPGEVYNICSGDKGTYSIQAMLDMLLKMSKVKVDTEQDPARMRPSDVNILNGDCSKFMKHTGWKPTIDFQKTMQDLLDYWRERV